MTSGLSSPAPPALGNGSAIAGDLLGRRASLWTEVVFDILAVLAAWSLTRELRLILNPWMGIQFTRVTLEEAGTPVYQLLLLWVLSAFVFGVYRRHTDESLSARFRRVVEAVLLAGTLTMALTFFGRELGANLSRSFVLLFFPVCFVMMTGGRLMAAQTSRAIERRWSVPERVAIIGAGTNGKVIDILQRYSAPKISLVGVVGGRTDGADLPWLGEISRLSEIINLRRVDRLVVVDGALSEAELRHCRETASRMGIVLSHAMSGAAPGMRVTMSEIGMLQLVDLRPVQITRRQEYYKRGLDFFLGVMVSLVLSPLLLSIYLAVKLTSEGPALYVAPRVGKGGRYFYFYKFRSMYTGRRRDEAVLQNEKNGHLFKMKQDPRITPVGRFIRRYSLDELPQLINVLRGDMSLVGPRPLPAEDLAGDGHSQDFYQWAEQRARVLPGITGLWQVKGRSDLDFEDMVRLDVEYVRHWSFWQDLKILLATPKAVLSGRGAY
jgi:exopolysaccharide biosynthesis polyprenyl glycosylphosphotransferase